MSERLTAEKALERLYEAATDTPAQPNNADELRETVARRLRTDPEADDPEGLVEWCEAKAQEAEDAMKDHSEGTVVAIEQSARAETFRSVRDRLREAGDEG